MGGLTAIPIVIGQRCKKAVAVCAEIAPLKIGDLDFTAGREKGIGFVGVDTVETEKINRSIMSRTLTSKIIGQICEETRDMAKSKTDLIGGAHDHGQVWVLSERRRQS
jgi:hypothetical protein